MNTPIIMGQRAVFIPHSGYSRKVPTIDRLADRLSEHGNLHQAAVECGISLEYAKQLFRLIQKGLGSQAR